jgi:hypothetical protein
MKNTNGKTCGVGHYSFSFPGTCVREAPHLIANPTKLTDDSAAVGVRAALFTGGTGQSNMLLLMC